MKKEVFVVSHYFKPGYLAGGPIQSVSNLIDVFENEYQFYIYTHNYDLNSKSKPYQVPKNKWIKNRDHFIYYSQMPYFVFGKLLKIKPKVIYFNSFFSPTTIFNIIPAILFKIFYKTKIVIAPRGELQKKALLIKSVKRGFILNYLN